MTTTTPPTDRHPRRAAAARAVASRTVAARAAASRHAASRNAASRSVASGNVPDAAFVHDTAADTATATSVAAPPAPATAAAPATGTPTAITPSAGRPARSTLVRLLRAEFRLTLRDPLVLTFVLAFPILTMLIIGGAFGTEPDPGFANQNPAHWYVASYFTVVIAAVGLIMLPVHLASYRERGVLRRFAVAGFPRWSLAVAELLLGLVTIAVAGAALLIVAAPVYGVPAVHDLGPVIVGVLFGSIGFVSIGVLLGTLLPSARAAQAVGMLLFFPSFLLGAGGPPPHVMGSVLRHVASCLPLTWTTTSIREPWLGLGTPTADIVGVVATAVVATALAARRAAL